MVKLPTIPIPKIPKIPKIFKKKKEAKKEVSLSANFLAQQKKVLEKDKERLEKELAEAMKFPDYGSAEDENAKEVEEYEKRLSVKGQLRDEFNLINSALKKIEKGTYGQCEVDREPIEQGRLKVYPAAPYCVKHAAEAAKKKWWQVWKKV